MKKPDASAFRLISMARNTHEFQTIRSEGGLLPPDLPRRVVDPKANLPGRRAEAGEQTPKYQSSSARRRHGFPKATSGIANGGADAARFRRIVAPNAT